MKNYGDLEGCYPAQPMASTDNNLLDFHNSSYDTQPHSLIVKYIFLKCLHFWPLVVSALASYMKLASTLQGF